jgi:hypothetical protein
MPRQALAISGGALAAAALGAVVAFLGAPGGLSTGPSAHAGGYPCSHEGGGVWEESWNNSSGPAPTHIWVPESGNYWVEYNDSNWAAADPGWETSGASMPVSTPGWTVVNMTNQSGVAESMMEYLCSSPGSSLPWHYDPASQTFVRDD